MKFPRNARIFRGQLDVTPFAGVFFCLLIFVILASFVYTPGVHITLPEATASTPGITGAVARVGLDPNGQYYYRNQPVSEASLVQDLREKSQRQKDLILIIAADKAVSLEQLDHLRDIAAGAGIKCIAQEIRPRMFDSPSKAPSFSP